jgi:hypothetical protein
MYTQGEHAYDQILSDGCRFDVRGGSIIGGGVSLMDLFKKRKSALFRGGSLTASAAAKLKCRWAEIGVL